MPLEGSPIACEIDHSIADADDAIACPSARWLVPDGGGVRLGTSDATASLHLLDYSVRKTSHPHCMRISQLGACTF